MTSLQAIVFPGIWSLPCALVGLLRCKSDLRGLIKSVAPHIAFTHCMLHKHTLVSKMLPSSLADVLKIVVETVNFVRGRALNHRIFMQLCKEMDSKFKVLLYHIEVRWLSQGKVMNCVFALRAELLELLKSQPLAFKIL